MKYVTGIVVAFLMPLVSSAAVTNWWQAVDGSFDGDWSDTRHWSLGHLPNSDKDNLEWAGFDVVPNNDDKVSYTVTVEGEQKAYGLYVGADGRYRKHTLTFKGTGKVTFASGAVQYIRQCDGVIIDGPDFWFTGSGNGLMCYAPLIIKGGSTWYQNSQFQLWRGTCALTLEGNATMSVSQLLVNNLVDSQIVVNKGCRLRCRTNYKTSDSPASTTAKMGLVINGGDVMIDGLLNLGNRATDYVTMKGGALRLSQAPNLLSDAQFDVSGGAVARMDIDIVQKDAPVDPQKTCGCRVFVPDGSLFKRQGTFFVSQISNASVRTQFDCDRLVFMGTMQPFTYGSNRHVELYGPMEIYKGDSGAVAGEQNCYKDCHGAITVHTDQYANRDVKHTVNLRGFHSVDGSLDLTVTGGGGTFSTCQQDAHDTCRSVRICEGITFELSNRANLSNYGEQIEWGPLATETLVLEKDVKVKFTAGRNFICASKWEVDPSVTFTVTIPAIPSGSQIVAFPILQDLDSKALPDAFLAQVTLTNTTTHATGEATGWKLKNEYGQISAYRDPDPSWAGQYSNVGAGVFEWKGGASGNKWWNSDNWYDSPVLTDQLQEKQTHVFGASASVYSCFDKLTSGGGTTAGALYFQTNATSFFIDGKQMTLTKADAIVSYSAVPQVLATGLRASTSGYDLSLRTYDAAPVVFSPTNAEGNAAQKWTTGGKVEATYAVKYGGDIRVGSKYGENSQATTGFKLLPVRGFLRTYPGYCARFTLIDSGDLTFDHQNEAFDVIYASFRVGKGGKLSFTGSDKFYWWSSAPANIVVDGTLNIDTEFRSSQRQVYGGSGTLNITGTVVPRSRASAVKFADALNVNLSADWPSEKDDCPLALGATAGSPVIHVPNGWTYGPVGTPTGTVSERSFGLENGATATIEPKGGTATFKDPVAGFGTLAITNGTLVVDCTCNDAAEVGFAARKGATLEFKGSQSFGSLDLAAGSTLKMPSDAAITLVGDANVDGATLDVGTGTLTSWRTLIASTEGRITGTPVLPGTDYKLRVMPKDDGFVFQCKSPTGVMVIFR